MTDEPNPDPPLDGEMDAALRDAYAFAPAAAEEAAARFRVPARRARWPWVALPAAVAAGVAAGILLPRSEPPPAPGPRVAGIVALATGAVADGKGSPLAAGRPIHEGEVVAAGADSRVSLILSDGSEVRLDRGSRVRVVAVEHPEMVDEIWEGRKIAVEAGRVWTRVSPGYLFNIDAGPAVVRVTGTELSVRRSPSSTGVQLFSGSARVEAGGVHRDLRSGQEVEFADGTLSDTEAIVSEALATGWMLDLVARTGGHDRELAEHLDRLLVDMGRTKAVMIEERKLVEELGGSCRVPLARYLVSEGAQFEDEPRRKAARVLVRIADASVAPELAKALRDPDPDVRVSAARALSRLSDGKACPDPEAFRAAPDEPAARAADEWVKGATPPR